MVAKKVNGLTKADNYYLLDLNSVKANSFQSRGHGVIPNLNEVGVGLFSQDEPTVNKKQAADKVPLWTLLTSDKPEDWLTAVGLIEEHEPHIKEIGDALASSVQLQNIGIVATDDGTGYDVVFGMRRCLGKAYNHARSGGELPMNVKAELATDTQDPADLHFRAMIENRGRLQESYIDEAKRIQFLKKQGLTLIQIGERLGTNQQNVRNRLQLLKLTPEEQQRVHTGKLGMVNALKMLAKKTAGQAPAEATAADTPENRKRMPTLKQAKTAYGACEKPDDMSDEEWSHWINPDFRKGIAYFIDVPYKSHKDMVKEFKDAEKAAKEAEKAKQEEELRKAAEASEKEEAEAAALATAADEKPETPAVAAK